MSSRSFKIRSPRELETILFDELKLPVIKRTKTARSTAHDVLEELKNAGKLGRSTVARSHSLRLPNRARCRLKFGELTFLINSVSAAVPVSRASFIQQLDPQLLRYLFSAAVLHALFFLIVLSIPEDADSLSMDGFDMSDRFVEFMLKPEDEQLKPEDLFGDLKEEGDKAEKAKEDEGQLGDRAEHLLAGFFAAWSGHGGRSGGRMDRVRVTNGTCISSRTR